MGRGSRSGGGGCLTPPDAAAVGVGGGVGWEFTPRLLFGGRGVGGVARGRERVGRGFLGVGKGSLGW